jgi:opacity protein-like surface antigen
VKLKRTIAVAMAAAGILASVIVPANPALAAEGDGTIDIGTEFILWARDTRGPLYDFATGRTGYGQLRFVNSQTLVDNHAGSGANFNFNFYVAAYSEPNFGGSNIVFLKYGQNNATQSWVYRTPELSARGMNNTISSHRYFS